MPNPYEPPISLPAKPRKRRRRVREYHAIFFVAAVVAVGITVAWFAVARWLGDVHFHFHDTYFRP